MKWKNEALLLLDALREIPKLTLKKIQKFIIVTNNIILEYEYKIIRILIARRYGDSWLMLMTFDLWLMGIVEKNTLTSI